MIGLLLRAASVILIAFLLGCQTAPSPEFTAEPNLSNTFTSSSPPPALKGTPTRFQVGDVLTINAPEIVEPHETLFRIQRDGTIYISSVGRIVAAGRTGQELLTEINQKDPRYAKGYIANCSCLLVYYVNGEVNNPGPKSFNETVTLLAALKAAGGFTKYADTNTVWLVRSPDRRERLSLGGTSTNINADLPVYSGNTIEVKRRSIFGR